VIAKPERRLWQTGVENDLLNNLGFNLCVVPQSPVVRLVMYFRVVEVVKTEVLSRQVEELERILGYAQPWLFTWYLFVEELRVYFGLSDPVGDAANLIDNLRMKPGDKIATYNVEFMWYAAQLNWGDTVLCHRFYQGLPNCLQDLIANREQEKPTSFHAMYQLAITFDNRYWERNRKRDCFHNTEKETADSHHRKQDRMAQYSTSSQNSALSRPQSSTTPPQTTTILHY